jgi:Arc/MetJ-type ribon-helix-helix transcriptional regulator
MKSLILQYVYKTSYMPTVSVRISDEDKKRLLRYGNLSKSIREALELYFREKKSQEAFRKLAALQRENPIALDPDEIVKLIREDRSR